MTQIEKALQQAFKQCSNAETSLDRLIDHIGKPSEAARKAAVKAREDILKIKDHVAEALKPYLKKSLKERTGKKLQ